MSVLSRRSAQASSSKFFGVAALGTIGNLLGLRSSKLFGGNSDDQIVTAEKNMPMPPGPKWLADVNARMEEVRRTPPNWDNFGAGPPKEQAIQLGLKLLHSVMQRSTPAPHISPTSNEGLQIEWHAGNFDLEIEIEGNGNVTALFEDKSRHTEQEIVITEDFTPLVTMIMRVTEATR